jgi:bifunctional non-homologous end joining protein LigD
MRGAGATFKVTPMTRSSSAGGSKEPLGAYNAKRDFKRTAEPAGHVARRSNNPQKTRFVIQKHWASRLHYDFRLELDGVLVSWAVPKGPSFDPSEKRMAVHVEDHPVSYGGFEGTIAKGNYGAGTVIVWDNGWWEPVGDPHDGLAQGKLVFQLHGQKLAGLWELVRIAKPGDKQDAWLLFKKRDEWARPSSQYDVTTALPDSVVEHPLGPLEEREPRDAALSAPTAVDLSKAVRAPMPEQLSPQLATLVAEAPPGDWEVETKFDGYRLLARVERKKVRLITRNGNDWTDRFPLLQRALATLGIDSAWIDGEIVVLDEHGVPDFGALQNAIDGGRNADIVFFVFDLPYAHGQDLRKVPLTARRALLKQLLDDRPHDEHIRFSEGFRASADEMLRAACGVGLEGVMLKRRDAPYVAGRSETWLKLKCEQRQEFVIAGFTDRTNAPDEVGSILLAYHDAEGKLRLAGNVGTGWNTATGRELHRRLSALETSRAPVDPKEAERGRWSRRRGVAQRWVEPKLVAEIAFGEWTADGRVRHARFKGLRQDKPAVAITREQAAATPTVPSTAAPALKVTHGERVIDPSTGLKKIDLVRYYESIADWMLPYLKNRPVSLVRAPEGIGGELFFQKHPETTKMPGLTVLDRALWPKHAALLAVDSKEALLSAAQMNVVEFHGWNSTVDDIDHPGQFVFDLDPGEGVGWQQVQEAALLVRTLLDELGLKSWLKTSGGKGLHVFVPITPHWHYDVVKAFSQAVVQHLAKAIPERFVAKSGGSNRVGRIFIDYLRNGHGQTTAVAFSARARPGLGVSMPVDWDQLMDLKGGAQWTIATARDHVSFWQADPWADFWRCEQTLDGAMQQLGFEPAAGKAKRR